MASAISAITRANGAASAGCTGSCFSNPPVKGSSPTRPTRLLARVLAMSGCARLLLYFLLYEVDTVPAIMDGREDCAFLGAA